jgi:hypothetical protein
MGVMMPNSPGTTKQSRLEATFAFQIRAAGLPTPQREFKAIPGRDFRFDFAWLELRLLAEIQGGIYGTLKSKKTGKPLGHNSITGMLRDMEKLNLATLAGYRVLQFSEKHIESGEALKWTQQAIAQNTKP